VLASLVLVTNAVAAPPSWTAPVSVRTKANLFLASADFSATNVAIAWDEPTSGGRRVGLSTSTDSGASFNASIYLPAINPAVDICNSTASDLAFQSEVAPDVWNIYYAPIGFGASSFVYGPVAAGPTSQHDPDVACYHGLASVAWYEEVSEGTDNMFVAYGSRTSRTFGTPIFLGTNDNTLFFGSLAVAAADGYTYEAFTRSNGDLRLRRSTVSGGSTPTVTPVSTQVIGSGSSNNQASGALIAAQGSKVAVVWSRCQGIFARVSNDHGATWGPVRTLFDEFNSCEADAAAGQESVAIRDGRIAVSYGIASAFGGGENRLIRTSNDFASFTDDGLGSPYHRAELIGFVTVSGSRKLADAFQKGFDNIRYRRQL
jgi:hypothetical protein